MAHYIVQTTETETVVHGPYPTDEQAVGHGASLPSGSWVYASAAKRTVATDTGFVLIDDEEVNDMDTYKIVRFYSDDRPRKVQQTGLSLEEAQAHCQDPSTRKEGEWFDGYEAE